MGLAHTIGERVFQRIHGNSLVYNTCWEDPRCDRRLLQLDARSRVVMLTSAGCNALDYLLKPFSYNEFYEAALRASEWFEENPVTDLSKDNDYIFVKSDYKQVRIDIKDIIYFESLKDYLKICVKDQPKPILTLMGLKALEAQLDPQSFMRVHRSFTISLDNVRAVERGSVLMSNGVYIKISSQHRSKFQEFINGKSVR